MDLADAPFPVPWGALITFGHFAQVRSFSPFGQPFFGFPQMLQVERPLVTPFSGRVPARRD